MQAGMWDAGLEYGQGCGIQDREQDPDRDMGYTTGWDAGGAGMQDGVGIQDKEQDAGRDVGSRIQEQGPTGSTGSSAFPLPPLPLAIPASLNPQIQPGAIPDSPKSHPGWDPNPSTALPHSFSWFPFTLRLQEDARIPWEEGLGCLGLPESRRAGDPHPFSYKNPHFYPLFPLLGCLPVFPNPFFPALHPRPIPESQGNS